jgi:hypothetical protein
LQRDPQEYVDSTNVYEYVRDRPTFATDPSGLLAWKCCQEWKRRKEILFNEGKIAKADNQACVDYFANLEKNIGVKILEVIGKKANALGYYLGFGLGLSLECERWYCTKPAPTTVTKARVDRCWIGCEMIYECKSGGSLSDPDYVDNGDGVAVMPGIGPRTSACR